MRAFLIATCFLTSSVFAQTPLRLDPTFNTGLLQFQMPTYFNHSYVRDMIPLEDGRMIITGALIYSSPGFLGEGQVLMARINNDGSRDPNFTAEAGGPLLTKWNDQFYSGPYPIKHFMDGTIDYSFDITNSYPLSPYVYSSFIYPNGSVLLSGSHTYHPTDSTVIHVNVARVDSTGSFDESFVPRTINYDGNFGYIGMTKPLANSKFVLSGSIFAYDGQPTGSIIRIHDNGDLDTTFHTTSYWGYAYDCHEFDDGKVMMVGHFLFQGISDTLNVIRLLPNGQLDPTFNNFIQFSRNGPSYQFPSVFGILPFESDSFILSGAFNYVDGYQRGGLVVIDENGSVIEDGIADPGLTSMFADQLERGSFEQVVLGYDGHYYALGVLFGYADDLASDPTQRGMIRLIAVSDVSVQHLDELNYSVGPNPTTDAVHVNGIDGSFHFRIYDGTARVVSDGTLTSDNATIQVRDWRPGCYVLHLTNAQGHRSVHRLIVQ